MKGAFVVHITAHSCEELISESLHPEIMQTIDAFIQETFPQLIRYLSQGETITLIGYGPMEFAPRLANGDYWALISLAPQKNNISCYIMGQNSAGNSIVASHAHHFPKSMTGKSCIRYRTLQSLDLELLREMITDAVHWYETQQATITATQ